MYEQITRVPMIIWAPQRFGQPRTVDRLVQQMDLGPTILDWAGIATPSDWEAQSLSKALESGGSQSFAGRRFVYCEQVRDAILTGCEFMTMIRDETHKLVHFLDQEEGQLFDLVADPNELENRWNDPHAAHDRQRLLAELLRWRIRSGVHTKDWCSDWR